jgi:UDP:flavonoid glycosyltransferase YjiC (YdhE family)
MTPRVLFAWELGANLGHLAPLASLPAAMADRGVEAWFCVRDLGSAALALPCPRASNVRVLQAPQWPRHRHWGHAGKLADLTDILAHAGAADGASLTAMMAAWAELIGLVRPDVIVADHAPALLALTHGGPAPVISIGSPFLMPPILGGRFAPLHASSAPQVPPEALAQTLRKARQEFGLSGPAHATDIFRTRDRFVFGLSEFDPYRSSRQEPLFDPPEGLPDYTPPPDSPRLFVYGGNDIPFFDVLVQALAGLNVPIEAHFRGENGPAAHLLRLRGHVVHDTPRPLAEILPRVSHVLSLGGLGASQAALAAGRPQLVAPRHDEAMFNVRVLTELGVAQQLWPDAGEHNLRKQIHAFIASGPRLAAAKEAALAIARRPRKCGRSALIAAIETHLPAPS